MSEQPEIAACPFCSCACDADEINGGYRPPAFRAFCTNEECDYSGPQHLSETEAVAAHNRIATAIPLERAATTMRCLYRNVFGRDAKQQVEAACHLMRIDLEQEQDT